jgi:hypothetical protein
MEQRDGNCGGPSSPFKYVGTYPNFATTVSMTSSSPKNAGVAFDFGTDTLMSTKSRLTATARLVGPVVVREAVNLSVTQAVPRKGKAKEHFEQLFETAGQ